jgi:hypothetical protein
MNITDQRYLRNKISDSATLGAEAAVNCHHYLCGCEVRASAHTYSTSILLPPLLRIALGIVLSTKLCRCKFCLIRSISLLRYFPGRMAQVKSQEPVK